MKLDEVMTQVPREVTAVRRLDDDKIAGVFPMETYYTTRVIELSKDKSTKISIIVLNHILLVISELDDKFILNTVSEAMLHAMERNEFEEGKDIFVKSFKIYKEIKTKAYSLLEELVARSNDGLPEKEFPDFVDAFSTKVVDDFVELVKSFPPNGRSEGAAGPVRQVRSALPLRAD